VGGQIFTTNEINNDGKVEIVSIWDSNSEYVRGEDSEIITFDYMYIFNWDGVNGNLLNVPTFKSGGMFEMIDLELDGVYEFRAYWEPIWGEYSTDFTPSELPWVIFGWNGSQYAYMQEIQTPGYQYLPTDGVVVEVSSKLSITGEEFVYNYTLSNDYQSKQRINAIYLKDALNVSNYKVPQNWKAQVSGSTHGISWYVFDNNKPSMIYPGNNLSGFGYDAGGLPSINHYYIQGYQPGPYLHGDYAPPFSIEEFRNNKLNNSVSGMTIIPKDPPDPFIPLNFLDTLINYNQHSFQLDWIANQATADKYDSLLNTAKTLLEGNHIPWVDSTLHTVLEQVDEDSTSNLTSEAYALLRYNTEYLLDNLPEIIPPILNSISTPLAIPYDPYSTGSVLTDTAKGGNFNDSSVVYFDGSAKATNFISDSVLTFQIGDLDITSTGDYPVWVSNYGSNSDTVYFSVVDSLPSSIIPVFECVQDNGDHTYTAFYGYYNQNSVPVFIPIGLKNGFTPYNLAIDRGQPTVFHPGVQTNVFSVVFDGSNLTWTLYVTNVTINSHSRSCP